MFDRLHHAGLAVADLDAAKKIFADALGLRVDDTRSPYPGGRKQRGADPTDILDIPIGDCEIELSCHKKENQGRVSTIFMRYLRDKYGHTADRALKRAQKREQRERHTSTELDSQIISGVF